MTDANRRLLEVESDMLDVVQERIREIRGRITSLEDRKEAATVDVTDLLRKVEERAQQAAERFERLEQLYHEADAIAMRAFLSDAIEHVSVGVSRVKKLNRWRYSFDGGDIVPRGDDELVRSLVQCSCDHPPPQK